MILELYLRRELTAAHAELVALKQLCEQNEKGRERLTAANLAMIIDKADLDGRRQNVLDLLSYEKDRAAKERDEWKSLAQDLTKHRDCLQEQVANQKSSSDQYRTSFEQLCDEYAELKKKCEEAADTITLLHETIHGHQLDKDTMTKVITGMNEECIRLKTANKTAFSAGFDARHIQDAETLQQTAKDAFSKGKSQGYADRMNEDMPLYQKIKDIRAQTLNYFEGSGRDRLIVIIHGIVKILNQQ